MLVVVAVSCARKDRLNPADPRGLLYVAPTGTPMPTGTPVNTGTPFPTETPSLTPVFSFTYTLSPSHTPTETFTPTYPDGKSWVLSTAAAGFVARAYHSAVVHDDGGGSQIWVIGGGNSHWTATGTARNDVWASPDGVAWTQKTAAAAFSVRKGHTSLSFDPGTGTKLWVIAGVSGTFALRTDVWYSADGISWTQAIASAAFGGRAYHTSVVHGGKMWVIGGFDAAGNSRTDAWSSVDGVTWTQETPATGFIGRSGHSSEVLGGKIFVVGGYGSMAGFAGGFNLSDVWSSTDGISWSQESPAAGFSPRFDMALATHGGRIYGMGGNDFIASYSDAWSTSSGPSWTLENSAAAFGARFGHRAVDFGGKIWIIGGHDGAAVRSDVWSSP